MTSSALPAAPDRIVDIATGFMGAKQLFAASRVGLFRALADGPRSLAELVADTRRSPRQIRILADAMLGLGLLERDAAGYRLAPDAATYLAGHGKIDLSPFLSFLNDISYQQWLGYDHTVDSDDPGILNLDTDGWTDFLAGVMVYNDLHAEQLVRQLDFRRFRNALDYDGISPTFAIQAMQQNPELRVRLLVGTDSAPVFSEALSAAGLDDRSVVVAGDAVNADLTGTHDLVMVNHVLHRYTAEQNHDHFAQARRAAAPGAVLTLLDFFLDDTGAQRKLDGIHAGEYYNIDGTVVYPMGVVLGWLEEAGWKVTDCLDLPGCPRVLLAVAV